MIYVIGYLAALATLVVVDVIWLGVMTPRFFRPSLGDILLTDVSMPPAIAFYVLYPVGLMIFAIKPAFKSGSIVTAIVYGALFGFFTDATRDLLNYASLRNWSLQLTLIDMAWGSALSAAAAAMGFWVAINLRAPG
jgi:uncharacterized membrane protein